MTQNLTKEDIKKYGTIEEIKLLESSWNLGGMMKNAAGGMMQNLMDGMMDGEDDAPANLSDYEFIKDFDRGVRFNIDPITGIVEIKLSSDKFIQRIQHDLNRDGFVEDEDYMFI